MIQEMKNVFETLAVRMQIAERLPAGMSVLVNPAVTVIPIWVVSVMVIIIFPFTSEMLYFDG